MKKTINKATLQTLDKKIDGLTDTVGTLTDTVDSLARSTKEGFGRMDAFHTEMTEFAQKTALTLFNMDSKLQTVDQRLDAIEKALGPIVHASSFYQSALREHERRIALLERKAGFSKS